MRRSHRLCCHLCPQSTSGGAIPVPLICGRVAFPTTTFVIDTADDEAAHNGVLRAMASGYGTLCVSQLPEPVHGQADSSAIAHQEVGTRCKLLAYDQKRRLARIQGLERCVVQRTWWEDVAWAEIRVLPEAAEELDEQTKRRCGYIR